MSYLNKSEPTVEVHVKKTIGELSPNEATALCEKNFGTCEGCHGDLTFPCLLSDFCPLALSKRRLSESTNAHSNRAPTLLSELRETIVATLEMPASWVTSDSLRASTTPEKEPMPEQTPKEELDSLKSSALPSSVDLSLVAIGMTEEEALGLSTYNHDEFVNRVVEVIKRVYKCGRLISKDIAVVYDKEKLMTHVFGIQWGSDGSTSDHSKNKRNHKVLCVKGETKAKRHYTSHKKKAASTVKSKDLFKIEKTLWSPLVKAPVKAPATEATKEEEPKYDKSAWKINVKYSDVKINCLNPGHTDSNVPVRKAKGTIKPESKTFTKVINWINTKLHAEPDATDKTVVGAEDMVFSNETKVITVINLKWKPEPKPTVEVKHKRPYHRHIHKAN